MEEDIPNLKPIRREERLLDALGLILDQPFPETQNTLIFKLIDRLLQIDGTDDYEAGIRHIAENVYRETRQLGLLMDGAITTYNTDSELHYACNANDILMDYALDLREKRVPEPKERTLKETIKTNRTGKIIFLEEWILPRTKIRKHPQYLAKESIRLVIAHYTIAYASCMACGSVIKDELLERDDFYVRYGKSDSSAEDSATVSLEAAFDEMIKDMTSDSKILGTKEGRKIEVELERGKEKG